MRGPSPASFEDSFDLLFTRAYQAAFRVLGAQGAAEDVALEALARACAKWSSIAGHAVPWVVKVSGALAIDQWRHQQHKAPRSRQVLDDPSEATDERIDLQRCLAELPRRQRQVMILRYFSDLSEADIASELGCSPGAVKQHAKRGLAGLGRQLRFSRAATITGATEKGSDVPDP